MPAARALARLANYDVLFVRHGNAPSSPDLPDLKRTLSEKGKNQCEAAARYLKEMPAPLASFAISSPSKRALETASIMLAGADPQPAMVEIESIYDVMLQPGASEIFQRIGYASLFAYMSDSDEMRDRLAAHGDQVIGALGATVTAVAALDAVDGKAAKQDGQRQTLCVFGHAVYLGAAALRLADLRAHDGDAKQKILQVNHPEAGALWVGGITSKVFTAEAFMLHHP